MRVRTTKLLATLALAAGTVGASPAFAEVVEEHDDHFITKAEAIVTADRKAAWLALISPASWWSSEHTWSADAANLRLTPQAGGCFCETIPEAETADGGFTLQGSVEHMRVIQAYPEMALRMKGALGPLQSEPVTGILTIALSEMESGSDGEPRTRIVWEYNVGGKMRYPIPVISKAVDGVMTLQLSGLAKKLGVADATDDLGEGAAADGDAPLTIDPEEAIESGEGADEAEKDARKAADEPENDEVSRVDEAFDDLDAG